MGFAYKGFEVYPAAQQLLDEDGTLGMWYGIASIVKWKGVAGPLVMPVS